jgi:predicted permease
LTAAATFDLFLKSLGISLPTFAWLLLGLLLRRAGLVSEALVTRVSLLAFRYGLPLMLFAGAAQVDYGDLGNARYLLAGVVGAVGVTLLSWSYSKLRNHPRRLQGIFVQSAFRSNLAIVGLALCVAAYGPQGTTLGALPVALMTVLYNVLAVWVLGATLGSGKGVLSMFLDMLRNPLILGIAAGVALAVSPLPVPAVVAPASEVLSAFFLPLVLVCIGASMDLSRLYRADAFAWEACFWRLLLAPLVVLLLAYLMGVRDEPLGILFLLVATPVAASSHVMVLVARGDGVLAANIVVLSTLLSALTITVGFFGLSLFNLVGQVQ